MSCDDSNPELEFLTAAENGDVSRLEELSRAGTSIDVRDTRRPTLGWTPLMMAAAHGRLEIVRTLVAANANLELAEDGNPHGVKAMAAHAGADRIRKDTGMTLGRTALHLALEFRQSGIARVLLEAGANPLARDFLDETPLSTAGATDPEFLRQALAGAVALDEKTAGKLLGTAAETGDSTLLDLVLNCGSKLSVKDLDGALLQVCHRCDVVLAGLLLAAGARVTASDKTVGTAWTAAVGATHYVKAEPGVPVPPGAIRSWNSEGPRLLVSQPEDRILAMLETLRSRSGDLSKAGPLGPPLVIAARHGMVEVAGRLLEWGGDKVARDLQAALEAAELYKQEAMLAFLKERPATAAIPDERPAEKAAKKPKRAAYRQLAAPRFKESKKVEAVAAELATRLEGVRQPFPERAGSFVLRLEGAPNLDVAALQVEFLEQGCFVVGYGSHTGDKPHELAIFPTTDPYQAIAAVGCDGSNYEVGSGNIVDWFKKREKEGLPVTLLLLDRDLVTGRFPIPIANPKKLATQMYDLCPDCVEQGLGTLEALEEALSESGDFTLWWD